MFVCVFLESMNFPPPHRIDWQRVGRNRGGPGSPSFLSTQHQLTPSPSPLQSRDYHFIGSDLRALYTNPNSMGGLHLSCQACLVPLSTILATGHQVARVRGCHTSSGMSNEVVVCIVEDLLFIFFSFRSFFARVIQTI